MTGLGGTGKTQLVLRYIEEHEEEYSAILWIDARSEETARSSYERCRRALRLPVEASARAGSLQEAPPVQAVLQWLQSRGQVETWLAVIDNADDLSWDVSSIVPQGRTRTVIVTSQDTQATRLLGGRSDAVKVDVMEQDEAVSLLENFIDEQLTGQDDERLRLAEELTESLDRLPLAIDLAGARIRVDVKGGDDVPAVIRQYMADYGRYREMLFQNEDFASISSYKKTVWTVWETSLSSLCSLESSQPNIYPTRLLGFFTCLDRASVQDELFRLASLGLQETCHRLRFDTPSWMKALLAKDVDGKWDDYAYRASMKALLRYGLVRPVGGRWKGSTMHSLVRWRASVDLDTVAYRQWHLGFMAAVCVQIAKESDKVQFRRHVIVHLPPNAVVSQQRTMSEEEETGWLLMAVSNVWQGGGRWKEAEQLQCACYQVRVERLGKEHPHTLTAMGNLAYTLKDLNRYDRALNLMTRAATASSKVLSDSHLNTLARCKALEEWSDGDDRARNEGNEDGRGDNDKNYTQKEHGDADSEGGDGVLNVS